MQIEPYYLAKLFASLVMELLSAIVAVAPWYASRIYLLIMVDSLQDITTYEIEELMSQLRVSELLIGGSRCPEQRLKDRAEQVQVVNVVRPTSIVASSNG